MAYLNKPNIVAVRAKGLHDSIDSVTGESEDDLNTPIDQRFD
jgi:hypothetical protein